MAKRGDMDHGLLLLIVAVLAWVVPGAGHFFIKEKKRAAIIFVTITATFTVGLYVGSIAVVDRVGARPWYVGQILTSPSVAIIAEASQRASQTWQQASRASQNATQVAVQYDRESQKAIKIAKEQGSPEAMEKAQLTIQKAEVFKEDAEVLTQKTREVEFASFGKPHDIGQIYTAIAGALNLLAILSAVYMAHSGRGEMIGREEDE
jgi:hypothetical protein